MLSAGMDSEFDSARAERRGASHWLPKSTDTRRGNPLQKTKTPEDRDLPGFRRLYRCTGGDGGIRTLDPGFSPDAPLAGECLRPLGHVSQTCVVRGRPHNEARILARQVRVVNEFSMTRDKNHRIRHRIPGP